MWKDRHEKMWVGFVVDDSVAFQLWRICPFMKRKQMGK